MISEEERLKQHLAELKDRRAEHFKALCELDRCIIETRKRLGIPTLGTPLGGNRGYFRVVYLTPSGAVEEVTHQRVKTIEEGRDAMKGSKRRWGLLWKEMPA